MLEDEFNDYRLHLKTLLTRVVDCKSVNEDNLTHLRAHYLTSNETSQSMTAQGLVVENDVWHHSLFTKMDKETQKAWERKKPWQ